MAWLVVLLSLLFSAATLYYLAENIQINTSTTDMLSAELPFRQKDREMSAAFPEDSDNILVVIDGQTADLADDAALLFSARLKQKPELFGRIFDPAGEEFFRKNGLLYLDVDELADLTDQLAEAQPFLAALWREPNLQGFFRMLGLAIEETAKVDGAAAFDLARILNAISDVAEAQSQNKFHDLSWRKMMNGGEEEASDRRRFLLIQPALNYGSLQPASDAIDGLREIAADLGFDGLSGVRVRLTGSAALSQEELQSVEQGMGMAGVISLTLVLLLLLVGMRSVKLTAAILMTLIMGLIWTAGFAIFALGALNLISVAFAVLFIGLSVDFGIHYGLRYQEGIFNHLAHGEALDQASRGVGGALTLCAISAAIAFYAFLPTDYVGLAELGLIAGTGMFIALFANITVLPAILTLMPLKQLNAISEKSISRERIPFSWRYSKLICRGALVVGLVSAGLSFKVDFDFDPLNLKDRNTESVSTLFDMMDDSRTSPYSIEVLTPNLDQAKILAEKLKNLPEVDSAATLANYVPEDQQEKLDLVGFLSLILSPSFATNDKTSEPLSHASRTKAVDDLAVKLQTLATHSTLQNEAIAAKRLIEALEGLKPAMHREFARRLLSGLPGRLEALKLSLQAGPVRMDDLPVSIVKRQLASDGRAMVAVYPRDDLRDRVALVKFVNAVRTITPDAIGSPVVILEAGKAILGAFMQAALTAITAIAIMLIVILGRGRDVMLVFAPLLLSALMTLAATVVLNLSFNFANMIVLPLLFGLGVAGSIHFVIRERTSSVAGGGLQTSTPRAVILSTLTTIGSFGSIALSSHPGTSSMGVLLTIAIFMTLFSTLVVLPALMAQTQRPDTDTAGHI